MPDTVDEMMTYPSDDGAVGFLEDEAARRAETIATLEARNMCRTCPLAALLVELKS